MRCLLVHADYHRQYSFRVSRRITLGSRDFYGCFLGHVVCSPNNSYQIFPPIDLQRTVCQRNIEVERRKIQKVVEEMPKRFIKQKDKANDESGGS